MKLYANWREILRRSSAIWCVWISIAGQTAQIVLPIWVDAMHPMVYVVLTFISLSAGSAAIFARLVEQKGI